MKITQIRESRENGDTEALSVMDINLLIEKMKRLNSVRYPAYAKPCILSYPVNLAQLPTNCPE